MRSALPGLRRPAAVVGRQVAPTRSLDQGLHDANAHHFDGKNFKPSRRKILDSKADPALDPALQFRLVRALSCEIIVSNSGVFPELWRRFRTCIRQHAGYNSCKNIPKNPRYANEQQGSLAGQPVASVPYLLSANFVRSNWERPAVHALAYPRGEHGIGKQRPVCP